MSHCRLLCVLLSLLAFAGAVRSQSPPGQHRAAGRDIESQQESDWQDNRWSRTEIGPFLASNLDLRGGKVAKGLSIKVGASQEGTVCYDTAAGMLRAGWLGGFLKLDPRRFGLISAPRVDGQITFTAPAGDGWGGRSVRYRGLHLRGPRVVLEYQAGAMRVLDSPWLENTNELKVFTRSLEIGPSPEETRFVLASTSTGAVHIRAESKLTTAQAAAGARLFGAGLIDGSAGAQLSEVNGRLLVTIPKHSGVVRLKMLLWEGSSDQSTAFEALGRTISVSGPDDVGALLAQAPSAHWLPELKTVGQRGLDTSMLAVDTLTLPYENPWRTLLFLAGVDFTSDGVGYVCSIHGDVWRVTGLDDGLRELKWKRFATGLFQPLGLKVRDDQVFVLGRDRITRLQDQNHDGEADFYENFCGLIDTSTSSHDFVTSLEKDNDGNFYYVDPHGAFRVSADGQSQEKLASGFRNPNGLGASPDGKIITVAPQQGEWTPSSAIAELRPDSYFGYGGPKVTPARPLGYDSPLCWIPHSVDNSSGSQVWVPSGRWGPLGGHFLHLLWGRCGLMLVLRDTVQEQAQGAVVPLPGRFLAGPNRGSFHPRDGHLYVAGSTGWQTSAVKDGALHRVRFTGQPVLLPIAWHAHSNGLTVTFSQPLARSAAEDPGSYAVQQWNYRYAAQYGSKDWSVANPKKEGRDSVEVKSARLLADGRTVFLEMPSLSPVMQMEVKYNLDTAEGKPMRGPLWLTLNKLDAARK